MLLHEGKAPRPVDPASDRLAHGKRLVAKMQNLSFMFADVQHLAISKRAEVTGLAAARRIEDRAVERDAPTVAVGRAGEHGGGRLRLILVYIKQLFGRHGVSSGENSTIIIAYPRKTFKHWEATHKKSVGDKVSRRLFLRFIQSFPCISRQKMLFFYRTTGTCRFCRRAEGYTNRR